MPRLRLIRSSQSRGERIIRLLGFGPPLLLAALLAAAPLPFGSVTWDAKTGLRIATFWIFCLAALTTGYHHRFHRLRWPVGLLAILACLGLLQSLSWPSVVVEMVSPRHVEIFESTAQYFDAVEESLRPALTLSRVDSRSAALTWLWVTATLAAAAILGLRRISRRLFAAVIVLTAAVEVLLGVPRWLQSTTTIWGINVPGDPSRLRGSFVNPDHLALFLEIALAVVFAWVWVGLRRSRGEANLDQRLLHVLPAISIGIVLFAGLAFTGSRAGMLAASLALGCQGLLLALEGRNWRLLPVGILAAVAGLGIIALLGPGQGFGRWIATSSFEVSHNLRRSVYAETIDLWLQFPLLGSGMGTYKDAFPLVQSARVSFFSWEHAHNAPLELLATVGVVGFSLALAAVVVVVALLSRILKNGNRTEDRAAALAALGALAAVSFHEMFDFGMVIPANGLALAVVVGAALAARTSSDPEA